MNNPTDSKLTLEVELDGHGLTGASTLVLAGNERQVYQLSFAPTAVGQHDGRSVLQAVITLHQSYLEWPKYKTAKPRRTELETENS